MDSVSLVGLYCPDEDSGASSLFCSKDMSISGSGALQNWNVLKVLKSSSFSVTWKETRIELNPLYHFHTVDNTGAFQGTFYVVKKTKNILVKAF